jgi:hypothetical protein
MKLSGPGKGGLHRRIEQGNCVMNDLYRSKMVAAPAPGLPGPRPPPCMPPPLLAVPGLCWSGPGPKKLSGPGNGGLHGRMFCVVIVSYELCLQVTSCYSVGLEGKSSNTHRLRTCVAVGCAAGTVKP